MGCLFSWVSFLFGVSSVLESLPFPFPIYTLQQESHAAHTGPPGQVAAHRATPLLHLGVDNFAPRSAAGTTGTSTNDHQRTKVAGNKSRKSSDCWLPRSSLRLRFTGTVSFVDVGVPFVEFGNCNSPRGFFAHHRDAQQSHYIDIRLTGGKQILALSARNLGVYCQSRDVTCDFQEHHCSGGSAGGRTTHMGNASSPCTRALCLSVVPRFEGKVLCPDLEMPGVLTCCLKASQNRGLDGRDAADVGTCPHRSWTAASPTSPTSLTTVTPMTAETTSSTTRCASTMTRAQAATTATTRTPVPTRSRHLGAHHQSIPLCAWLIQLTSNRRKMRFSLCKVLHQATVREGTQASFRRTSHWRVRKTGSGVTASAADKRGCDTDTSNNAFVLRSSHNNEDTKLAATLHTCKSKTMGLQRGCLGVVGEPQRSCSLTKECESTWIE